MEERLDKENISFMESIGPETVIKKGMFHKLFQEGYEISPNLSEVYELALAYYESKILTKSELIKNSAYFVKVEDAFTNHFAICTGDPLKLPDYSSSRLKSFFSNNQFRTGYASHGLFPYRGKFHPQMIKALINIIGVKPGETLMDPMMGSGTVPVEASLMGIKSIGIDSSPFCRFMAQAKCDAMTIQKNNLKGISKKSDALFSTFSSTATDLHVQKNAFIEENSFLPEDCREKVFNLLFLAFLDSEGYAQRSQRKSHIEHFRSILERYIAVVNKFIAAREHIALSPSPTQLICGDARSMGILPDSVDGIIFSPPYSFAIDYLKNDQSHLRYFKNEISTLSDRMIGLRGKALKEKYELYIDDMKKVLSQCFRVLKSGRFCVIIIGTNDSQLSKALKRPKEDVKGLNQIMVDIGRSKGFAHIRSLPRQIVGMANTMRQEYIIFLQKE